MTMLSLEERVSKLERIVYNGRTLQDILFENVEYLANESSIVLYETWGSSKEYHVGDRCIYLGNLYECIQAHQSQDDWTPPTVPALWKLHAAPGDEWPEWVQPTGAHDAYALGDKVSHNGKHWISSIDVNVYEPGVYGWDEASE